MAQGVSQPGVQLDGELRSPAAGCTTTTAASSYIAARCCARSASTASCTVSSRCWPTPADFAWARWRCRHRRRRHGASKYGVSRFIKGFLDLVTVRFLTRFRQRPLHMLGGFGLALFGLGGLGMISLAIFWLDPANRPIGNRPLLFYSIALLLVGLQLVTVGILAELVTAYNVRPEDVYSIAERVPTSESPCCSGGDRLARAAAFLTTGSSGGALFLFQKSARRRPRRDGGDRSMEDFNQTPVRSEPRRLLAPLVIIAATALGAGTLLASAVADAAPTTSRAGARSGACSSGARTLSMTAHGKLKRKTKSCASRRGAGAHRPASISIPASRRYLPTLIAGILYPARKATGIPLDRVVLQERAKSAGARRPTPILRTG